MKAYFVITDIHSFYTPMMDALKKKGFDADNPNHYIISCGDIMDRGTESKEVLNFFISMLDRNRLIAVRGNHEDLFDDMITAKDISDNIYTHISNGTIKTLGDLCDPVVDARYQFDTAKLNYDKRWNRLRSVMLNFYELDNYIFVHGWIPSIEAVWNHYKYENNWRNASLSEWKLARWDNGMKLAYSGVIEPGKIIVCGHWHTSYGNVRKELNEFDLNAYKYHNEEFDASRLDHFKPYESDGIIALDACTAFTGFCNCMKLTVDDSGKVISREY